MKVTITCDSENTMKFIDYILRMGSCNSREKELREWGIDTSDTHLGVTYALDVESTVEMEVNVEQPEIKKKESAGKMYLYAARDTSSGKLVSDLTNPRRKYWDREVNARSAINYANASPWSHGRHEHVELVKFELVEVPTDTQ